MRFQTLEITNYKSFDAGSPMHFGPGFNIVVGQNNTGKSAILEGFSISTFGNIPHRAKGRSAPHQVAPISQLSARIIISGSELKESLIAQNGAVWLTAPSASMIDPLHYFNNLFGADELSYDCGVHSGAIQECSEIPLQFDYIPSQQAAVSVTKNGDVSVAARQSATPQTSILLNWITHRSIFGFKAERFSVGQHGFADASLLDQNARNLPVVLFYIQGNRLALFSAINAQMREIFPSLSSISVGPLAGDLVVRIWSNDGGDDISLSNELNLSGTGIGQALAILTVAATISSGVIVIDELNSFLHPLAVKRLINILRTNYSSHQYIVSSHAIEIIKWADPYSVILVKKSDSFTETSAIDRADVNHLRETAHELGFSVADVFGAERILWVEGQTEEECFPLVLREFGHELGDGAAIVALAATSGLSSHKTAEAALSIYDRVSAVASPFTKGVVVALDREGLSDDAVERVHSTHAGRIFLTDRRAFENYILHFEAISRVLISETANHALTAAEVEQWFLSNGGDQALRAKASWTTTPFGSEWLKQVDAPKLLTKLFSELTDARLEFRKRKHCLEIVQQIVLLEKDFLLPLAEYLAPVAAKLRSLG